MMDNNDILFIEALPFPYDPDAKMFNSYDEEGNVIGEPFSYNEWIQHIKDISGVTYGRRN